MTISLSAPLILASASPRRQELLRFVGLKFKTIPAHLNEDYIEGERPRKHVKRLSQDKAIVIAKKYPNAVVLGADTIVVIDKSILGKPENKYQARKMLRKLSGREHKVYTGFTIAQEASKICHTNVVLSAVKFKKINPQELEWYVASDEPYDKAGGYAVQGRGAYFIQSIRGSYTNVIGLPLCEVLETLKKLEVISFG
jgi:septum formation protein